MATEPTLIFSEQLSGILNAYNDNIVRFSTNDPDPLYATIDIYAGTKNYTFKLTPSPDSEFYFNFRTIITKLINGSMFADSCPYSPVGDLWQDANAFLEIEVEYTISFSDHGSETVTETYHFVKGVNQLTEKDFYNTRGTAFPLHSPEKLFLTFFQGYPFDISLFGENISLQIDSFLTEPTFIAADLAAMNPSSHQEVTFTNSLGAQRLIISDGPNKWSRIFDKYHSITFDKYLIRLRMVDKCGIYLKWHNQYGGWDYWLFDNYSESQKDKAGDMLPDHTKNLPDAIAPVSTGKELEKTTTIYANGVYAEEITRVMGIAASPKVYLFTGGKGTIGDWIEVQVTGKNKVKKSAARMNLQFEMKLQQFTLTI